MQTRATTEKSEERPKQKQAEPSDPTAQPCSLCSGQLMMDAQGTALFCDECWNRKWFLALGDD